MTREEAIVVLENEIKCVDKDCNIERSCGNCPYAMPSKEPILEAYRLAIETLEQEPCTDAISRQAALDIDFKRIILTTAKPAETIEQKVKALPPVTPPQPKIGYISIDDVMSVFDDFMCGEVDEDGTDTFLEMLKDKAESEG